VPELRDLAQVDRADAYGQNGPRDRRDQIDEIRVGDRVDAAWA
jgi:hypothetical protein